MKNWIILVSLLISQQLHAQEQQVFSKKEMYADFDTLVAKLRAVSPHIAIKKDLWHYDAISQILKLRQQIDTISSKHAFAVLIDKALNACQDFHSSIWSVPFQQQQKLPPVRLFLPVSYFNGKYYLTASLIPGGDTIPIGSEIIGVNGYPINRYIADHLVDKVCSYDPEYQRFYSNRFYRNTAARQEGEIALTTLSPQLKRQSFLLSLTERAPLLRSMLQDTLRQKVEYWPDQQVLYIRVFSMEANDIPFFMKKIRSFSDKAAEMKKVIVDLRDNQGGEDTVWMSIYQAILPKKTFKSQISGYYPSYLDSDYIAEHDFDFARLKKNRNSLLKKYRLYDYVNTTDSIMPADASLNFTGKFIVMGNENIYSAGASAMMIPNADPDDNIISMGRKTNLFLGGGFSPVVFELPHSKIQYRIAPSIETNGVHKLADLMQDKVEVEVPYSMEEFYTKERYRGDAMGTYYLQHFDPFIKIALKL